MTPNCQGCHAVTFPVSVTCVRVGRQMLVYIQCVCECFARGDGRERRRQRATDSLFPVTGKVSRRTSARPLPASFPSLSLSTSLALFPALICSVPFAVSSICCCGSQYAWKLFWGTVASNKHTCLNACCLLDRRG